MPAKLRQRLRPIDHGFVRPCLVLPANQARHGGEAWRLYCLFRSLLRGSIRDDEANDQSR
jgi:hypothetical protein